MLAREEQVLGLEVAVREVLVVHVLERRERLAQHVRRLFLAVALQLDDAVKEFTTSDANGGHGEHSEHGAEEAATHYSRMT